MRLPGAAGVLGRCKQCVTKGSTLLIDTVSLTPCVAWAPKKTSWQSSPAPATSARCQQQPSTEPIADPVVLTAPGAVASRHTRTPFNVNDVSSADAAACGVATPGTGAAHVCERMQHSREAISFLNGEGSDMLQGMASWPTTACVRMHLCMRRHPNAAVGLPKPHQGASSVSKGCRRVREETQHPRNIPNKQGDPSCPWRQGFETVELRKQQLESWGGTPTSRGPLRAAEDQLRKQSRVAG